MAVIFYLKKKESYIPSSERQKAEQLKQEIQVLSEKVKELGYDNEAVSEIRRILLHRYGHPIILKETENNERTILGRINGKLKPKYAMSYDYECNLSSMKKSIEKQLQMNIVRLKDGKNESVVSFDDFVKEMQEHPWTAFGMPKKYNSKEETIWDWLRGD